MKFWHKASSAKDLYKEDEGPAFSAVYEDNVRHVQDILVNCCDIERHLFPIGDSNVKACLFFVQGLADSTYMTDNILKPLKNLSLANFKQKQMHTEVKNTISASGKMDVTMHAHAFVMALLSGKAGILIEGFQEAYTVAAADWEERSVEESPAEVAVKGMRAGFVENIRTNTALLRRMIKSPKLKFEKLTVGKYSNTEINISYIEGIVMDQLVQEAKAKIQKICVDGMVGIGSLQENIAEHRFSIFNESYTTERPDRACSSLLEGRLLILMDNAPSVIIAPISISQFVQAIDDYNSNYAMASFSRLLRYIAINMTFLLSGLYISFFSYHHEMIPTDLLKTVSQAREQLPFPIFFEMLILEIAFEILREAGIRLPRAVGQAVSIVGALVIGQAAVAARLVSPPSIIVVALSAIGSFVIPITEAANSYRLMRFGIIVGAGLAGIPGMLCAALLFLIHMCAIRSFGTPYMAPISPFHASDWKDFLIRIPMNYMKNRPVETGNADTRRKNYE